MSQNQAAWLDAPGKPFRIAESVMPSPGPNEIVVRNRAVAINTIDAVQAATGRMLDKAGFPLVLGHDVAGEVHEVGSSVTKFKKGDRIIAHAWSMITKNPQDAGFALFTKVQAGTTAVLPERVEFKEGVVLPTALNTAAAGLFQDVGFGLPWPRVEDGAVTPAGKVLVLYGGSSAVGLSVTQLATAAGVRVISIASPRNHGLCRSLGASDVFDQKDSNLIENITSAIQASNDNFLGVFDAISEADTYAHSYQLLAKFGGGKLVIVHPPPENIPAGVDCQMIFALGKFCFPLWEEFVPKALESGELKCLPEAEVVGRGLESVQRGVERWFEGVSAKKIVVEL